MLFLGKHLTKTKVTQRQVNNAGVMIIPGIGQPVSYEDAKFTFDVNYYGTKRLTEKLLPLLRNK